MRLFTFSCLIRSLKGWGRTNWWLTSCWTLFSVSPSLFCFPSVCWQWWRSQDHSAQDCHHSSQDSPPLWRQLASSSSNPRAHCSLMACARSSWGSACRPRPWCPPWSAPSPCSPSAAWAGGRAARLALVEAGTWADNRRLVFWLLTTLFDLLKLKTKQIWEAALVVLKIKYWCLSVLSYQSAQNTILLSFWYNWSDHYKTDYSYLPYFLKLSHNGWEV